MLGRKRGTREGGMEGDEETGSPSRERSAEKRAPHSLSDLSGSGE